MCWNSADKCNIKNNVLVVEQSILVLLISRLCLQFNWPRVRSENRTTRNTERERRIKRKKIILTFHGSARRGP